MSLITLTTDFGLKDHFVGAVKGAIITELPTANIIDITHEVSPFNTTEAAYVIKNAYKSFPDGTIHIIGVDSEFSIENKHIVLELDNHYFICPDNGIISMVVSEIRPTQIFEINIHDNIRTSFPVLDVFVKVATHIARGGTLSVIGREISDYTKLKEMYPKVNLEKTIIKGEVIYIDNYENVITNISEKLFNEIGKTRKFEVRARSYKFDKIHYKYNEIEDFSIEKKERNRNNYGTRMALFNSSGFLEIAVYKSHINKQGGASSLLGLHYRDSISIHFENTKEDAETFNIHS